MQHTCMRDDRDGLRSMTKTRRYWSAMNVTSVSGARKKDGWLEKCSRSQSTLSDGTQDNTSNSSSLLYQKKRKKVYSLRVAANQTVHCQVTTTNTNHAFASHVSKNNAYAKFTHSHPRQCALPLHLLFCLVALYWSISCTKLSEHSLKHYFCFPYTNIPLLLEKPTGNTADSDLFAITYHIKISMHQR